MPNTIQGSLTAPKGRFALVAARFNEYIVRCLVDGAVDALKRHGVGEQTIDLAWVPGSFEIPLIAKTLAASGKYAAIVALGCVIRGETDHYRHVASQAASGVMQASLMTGVPVIFGILTCDTLEQAINRAGGKAGNKGFDAAVAALEMANLLQSLSV
jgi:6,7-dimethyl-8-ribityllumazine synthase